MSESRAGKGWQNITEMSCFVVLYALSNETFFCRYENVQDKDNLPASALLPMQSNDYLTSLATKEEKMVMPMELDAEQKNIQHAMISLAEKNIHFAILSWQCSNLENTLKGYNINLQTYLNSKAPLALLKLFFKNNFCKNGLKMVKSNGFSQTTTEELDQLAKNDLKVLAEMLGEKEFFFGNAASLLDLVVFSHLAQVTVVDESATCPLRDHIKTEHENLVALVDRYSAPPNLNPDSCSPPHHLILIPYQLNSKLCSLSG